MFIIDGFNIGRLPPPTGFLAARCTYNYFIV